jgi:hypothetical protein
MRHLLSLIAATSLVACHSRNEEQVGAAPASNDTTAVTHVIDSTRTGPPGVGGRPGNATVTLDSVMNDSTKLKRDTVLGDTVLTPTSTPQDTLGPGTPLTPDSTTQR